MGFMKPDIPKPSRPPIVATPPARPVTDPPPRDAAPEVAPPTRRQNVAPLISSQNSSSRGNLGVGGRLRNPTSRSDERVRPRRSLIGG